MSTAPKPESLAEIEARFGKRSAVELTRERLLTDTARAMVLIERAVVTPVYGPTKSTNSSRYPACCEKAVRRECVCVTSWECPDHGEVCRGSHD